MRTKAAAMVPVRDSSRKATPAATATAGLMYVKTTARVGPTSRISSRKTTNASAVHSTPRPTSEASTLPDGVVSGQVAMPAGA
ncbi:hypothetical protein QBL21_25340 [Streptomyces sp. 184]